MKNRKEPGNESSGAILSALLVEMDGKRKNCYVLANTNEPGKIGESYKVIIMDESSFKICCHFKCSLNI